MHSVRVPVWQTESVWPVRTAHVTVLLTVNIISHNPAQSSSDNIPSWPPDNTVSWMLSSVRGGVVTFESLHLESSFWYAVTASEYLVDYTRSLPTPERESYDGCCYPDINGVLEWCHQSYPPYPLPQKYEFTRQSLCLSFSSTPLRHGLCLPPTPELWIIAHEVPETNTTKQVASVCSQWRDNAATGLPTISTIISHHRDAVFGHIARLQKETPATAL